MNFVLLVRLEVMLVGFVEEADRPHLVFDQIHPLNFEQVQLVVVANAQLVARLQLKI